MSELTADRAEQFISVTLAHLEREFPNKLDHVMAGPDDVARPAVLHPIFHGSFDWHSCVHGWWQVLRLLRAHPQLPECGYVRARADRMLVSDKVVGELAYLARPESRAFERPYGWAWLLALHGEAAQHEAPWAAALEPLAEAFAARFKEHLPQLTYPIRVGTHFNTSFALTLAYDWSCAFDPGLGQLIESRARQWFEHDAGCQAWEPGGDEFLSPALCEALLMSRVLERADFARWFDAFLPEIAVGRPGTLLTPAIVANRSDDKIVHLDGLNLSRAWCWREIAATLGTDHPVYARAGQAAELHLTVSLPHVAGDYAGEHWLATFAVLALTASAR